MKRAFLAVVVAAAVGVAGCASRTSLGPPATTPPWRTTTTTPTPLSARLALESTTVRTGGALSGRIIVENDTGHALHASGCGGIFQVVLKSSTYHPEPVWPTCLGPVTIPTGTSTYPVQVEARYGMCGQGGGLPRCVGAGPPGLPPGEYQATTVELGHAVPLPSPVAVEVTE
jgi:hypothetical protein